MSFSEFKIRNQKRKNTIKGVFYSLFEKEKIVKQTSLSFYNLKNLFTVLEKRITNLKYYEYFVDVTFNFYELKS